MTDIKVIAKVGNKEFTNEDFQRFLSSLDPNIVRHFMNEENGFETILKEMLNQELMLHYAEDENLEDDEEFQRVFQTTKENLLKNYAYQKIITSAPEPTEEEIKEYFEAHKKDLEKTFVNASHILVEDQKTAEDIKAKIDNGENFEELAKEYSTCPSKDKGGNLGDFCQGQMVPEFDEVVFKMEEGEVAGPVQTQFGFHVIKLNKINATQNPDLDTARENIIVELKRVKQLNAYQTKVEELKEEYPVEILL